MFTIFSAKVKHAISWDGTLYTMALFLTCPGPSFPEVIGTARLAELFQTYHSKGLDMLSIKGRLRDVCPADSGLCLAVASQQAANQLILTKEIETRKVGRQESWKRFLLTNVPQA